ncbi:hypothetical protein [Methanoregula sp.]|uniref:hypothetical protein n=1 Tax=Methanoregula sp. TaxID=2052170 RepID=UPI003C759EA4
MKKSPFSFNLQAARIAAIKIRQGGNNVLAAGIRVAIFVIIGLAYSASLLAA